MASQEKVGEVLHAFEKQMIANEAAGLKSNIPKMGWLLFIYILYII